MIMRVPAMLVALALIVSASGALAASSHQTMHDRFAAANITHDGHLTLEQAKAGYKSVAKKFDAIDKDHKGYVTEADIHAYYSALHHHKATQPKS
jgi:hypothetical protein